MAVQRCTKAAVGPPCRHKLFAKPANSPRNRVCTLRLLSSSKQSPSPCRDVFQRNESLKNESLEKKKNKVTVCYLLWSGLLVSRDEGGSREHALKWRPSFTPSFARLPSFKNAAPRRTGSKTTPAPASTKHAYNSTFGGGASAGQGNDKYAGKIPPLFLSLSLFSRLYTLLFSTPREEK